MSNTRVVITGLGVVSSIGIGKDEFWSNLIAGKSGISKIELFDTSKHKRHYGGEIKNFDPAKYISSNKIKFFGRSSQFAIIATKLALKDALISSKDLNNKNTAIIIGATMPEGSSIDSSTEKIFTKQQNTITQTTLLNIFSPSVSRNIGIFFGIKGYNLLIPCACAAANYCLGYSYDILKKGGVDFVIAGGAESLSRIAFQGFQRIYSMAPEKCTPFDKNRRGMLLGEGSGILILETLEHALKRNATIYAEIKGYGHSCDAFHITIPNKRGILKVMKKALLNAQVDHCDIDYISAHGTGTGMNDKEESSSINTLFNNRKVPTSSIKSMLGHCLGAASALESIACCLTLTNNIMPPTINYTTPDPECDIDCIPNQAKGGIIKYAINNSFAFGGNNCCVVFGKN
jgi:3-oxoacyl-[acyl-carrier-protein] synthase II